MEVTPGSGKILFHCVTEVHRIRGAGADWYSLTVKSDTKENAQKLFGKLIKARGRSRIPGSRIVVTQLA